MAKKKKAKLAKARASKPKKVTISTTRTKKLVVQNPKKPAKRARARKPKRRQTTITVKPNPKKKRRAPKRPRGPDELTREARRLATRGRSGDRASMSAGYWRLPRSSRAANLRRLVRKGPKHKRAAAAIARAELAHEGPPRRSNPRMGDAAALQEYERTHWGERGRGSIQTAKAADPRHGTATKLGRLHSVVYETIKGGDRELTQYEHTFEGKKPVLAYNDGGLLIAGGTT